MSALIGAEPRVSPGFLPKTIVRNLNAAKGPTLQPSAREPAKIPERTNQNSGINPI
jgi:hypothetical protein